MEQRPWAAKAACIGRTKEFVFDADKIRNKTLRPAIQACIDICNGCPVLDECRQWSLLSEFYLSGAVVGGMHPHDVHRARNTPELQEARRFINRHPCGTSRAYATHLHFGEDCAACRDAHRIRNNPGQAA